MPLADRVPALLDRLTVVYGDRAGEALSAIEAEFADLSQDDSAPKQSERWNERDVVLITYADQLRDETGSKSPLATLREWLVENGLDRLLSTVHLLPFCPYSSDDGFSVIDYLAVDPESGTWEDIAALGEPFDLMFDLVLNHISQHSEWFEAYLRGEAPYDRFFLVADRDADHSAVVRPRSLPLLHDFETSRGVRHVWTTFSRDQVDLNYGEPLVLARMLRILVEYALRGARIIRLDAVAFLWKRLGTNCLHLAETHELVKLMRDVLAACAPRTLVLTETNVPHEENVSYFGAASPATGEADEAHMVYNFSLPPLLLEAFLSGDATAITAWLENLEPPPPGCTFFNFTASHDGVGVRPLEGLVAPERFDRLVEAVKARGARINTRRQADGSDTPYELCITYFSALAPTPHPSPPPEGEAEVVDLHVRRFLASQAVMMALKGMPAVYFHSLVGSPNDTDGADESGIHRRINRHKYERGELDACVSVGMQRSVFEGMRELLAKRIAEPAFHPDASQRVVEMMNPAILGFERESLDGKSQILVLTNVAETVQGSLLPPKYAGGCDDLISGGPVSFESQLALAPGQAVWLRRATG